MGSYGPWRALFRRSGAVEEILYDAVLLIHEDPELIGCSFCPFADVGEHHQAPFCADRMAIVINAVLGPYGS